MFLFVMQTQKINLEAMRERNYMFFYLMTKGNRYLQMKTLLSAH